MKSKDFIAKILSITPCKTVYMLGTFGAPVTEALIAGKAKQLSDWYTAAKQAELRKLIGKGYFAFDCVGLIKGILWGWTGTTAAYGGAKYASNSVPDTNADGMISKCSEVSTDFRSIVPGEAVWMPGHIGVYIGGGKVAECTPKWNNNVQITACLNIGSIAGLNGRKWVKYGKLPYLEYEENTLLQAVTTISARISGGIDIKGWAGTDKEWKAKNIDALLLKIAAAWKG